MQHPVRGWFGSAVIAMAFAAPAMAADITVQMHKATQDGTGESIGTVTISETDAGTALKLDLHGLPPGQHGFHVHENANCGPTLLNGVRIPAGAAGSHLDPEHTGKHQGPMGEGHLGDLPAIEADASGKAAATLVAGRIKDLDTLKGHALIIHAGGDNYQDSPLPLGGGGSRFACGTIG
jgi:Cu-Zn family superoxide dismutase